MSIVAKQATGQLSGLTGLRAVAATMVFVHHMFPYIAFIRELHIGVVLFFVLSGFLMYYNYSTKFKELKFLPVFNYGLARIARILPTYWIVLALFFILHTVVFKSLSVPNIIFKQMFLLKGLYSAHYFDTVAQSWSLTVEFCFYALFPVMALVYSRNRWFALLLVVVPMLIGLGLGHIFRDISFYTQSKSSF